MRGYTTFACFVLAIAYGAFLTEAQLPPRLNIPGALLLQQSRPAPAHRQQRLHHAPSDAAPIPIRLRKPIPNALPISIPIREEAEEDHRPSILDDEVARLSISALQASRAAENVPEPPRPVQFRPERPVPVLRQDLRESQNPPPRPFLRQELDDEEENIPIIRPQQPVRQAPPQQRQYNQPPQQNRQQKPVRVAAQSRPQPSQYLDEEDGRRGRPRKPQVQILRKYRTDNDDGSITWGFENDDGTFKEENIGIDCVIRGKYGYIDPEGTKREYNYEAGNKCDPREAEYPLEELPPQQVIASRPSKRI